MKTLFRAASLVVIMALAAFLGLVLFGRKEGVDQ